MRNGISFSSVSKGIRAFDESDYDDLINLMKTGIGQSKYCIPQPFSPCLISLCSSLFDLNSIFFLFRLITILFDPTLSYIDRSRLLQWSFKP